MNCPGRFAQPFELLDAALEIFFKKPFQLTTIVSQTPVLLPRCVQDAHAIQAGQRHETQIFLSQITEKGPVRPTGVEGFEEPACGGDLNQAFWTIIEALK